MMEPNLPTPTKTVSKPSRPCACHKCENKTTETYCEDHEHLVSRQKWGDSDQKFYNSTKWRKTTKAYRRANPLCEQCLKEGRTTPWQQTDHIVPVSEGGAKFDWDNLQSLCRSCHASKSVKEMNNG